MGGAAKEKAGEAQEKAGAQTEALENDRCPR